MTVYSKWKPTGFDCSGLGLDDRQDWLVCPCILTRDSGPLERSNFEVIRDDAERDQIEYEVHRFGHWACGWFEIILVHPNHTDWVEEWEKALENYPVACDSHFSQTEWDEAMETWESWGANDLKREIRPQLREREKWHFEEWVDDNLEKDKLWEIHLEMDPGGPYCTYDSGVSFGRMDYVEREWDRLKVILVKEYWQQKGKEMGQ